MAAQKHQCCKTVFDYTGFFTHPCSINATVFDGGKWYCRTHSPEGIKRRSKQREARSQIVHDAEERRRQCERVRTFLYDAALKVNPSNPMAIASNLEDLVSIFENITMSVELSEDGFRIKRDGILHHGMAKTLARIKEGTHGD